MTSQEYLIYTNDNCTGCNRCITSCTVPEANVARMENGKNKIYVDGTKCINCGECIKACPHDAREYLDDTEAFFRKLESGGAVSVLAAPAIRSNFPQYKQLLGALKSLGVKSVYDTSFGADITTWAYLRYLEKNKVQGMISQPCPAIVNYIERHDTSLLPKLIPVHSPVMCNAVYLRKYKNVTDEIAFLSPCIAKKNEMEDPNNKGLIQYNVTFKKLEEALKRRNIDYTTAPPAEYDNPESGLGSLYPLPGGLKANVDRHVPGAWVMQVEGQPKVHHFLDQYASIPQTGIENPLLIDILNCPEGCNLGTGALCSEEDSMSVGRKMHQVEAEANKQNKKLLGKTKFPGLQLEDFDKMLRLDDFIRIYSNKYTPPVSVSAHQVEAAFNSLYKTTPDSRRIDCGSCGFNSCQDMATAVAKNINHVENCVEYHKSVLENQQKDIQNMLVQRERLAEGLKQNSEKIFTSVSSSSEKAEETTQKIASINEELATVENIAARMNEVVDTLSKQISQYAQMGESIVNISLQTRLLSLNAEVEAAHAGAIGKGFAVVAEEMKNLSDKSGESANQVLSGNEIVFPLLEEVRSFAQVLNTKTQNIAASTLEMQQAVESISQTEHEIAGVAAEIVQEQS